LEEGLSMLAIIMTPTQHEYLSYVFQEYCKAGVPPPELAVAADAWKALSSPQKFDLPGTPETVAIKGPVAVQVNGDMTMPLSALPNPANEGDSNDI
jgi:hypothetical protein